jgi:hypothetical protein
MKGKKLAELEPISFYFGVNLLAHRAVSGHYIKEKVVVWVLVFSYWFYCGLR